MEKLVVNGGMEKLVVNDGGPPDREAYESQNSTYDLSSELVDSAGLGFKYGTAIGFVYKFIKGNNSCGFKSRLCSALAKSPCIGGNFALMALAEFLSWAACLKYTEKTTHTTSIPYEISCACAGIGGAVGFARHGLRPALLGALTSIGLTSIGMMSMMLDPHRTSISETKTKTKTNTNTYTYPYYRRPTPTRVDDIPWPEALWSQDNSETSIPRVYDDYIPWPGALCSQDNSETSIPRIDWLMMMISHGQKLHGLTAMIPHRRNIRIQATHDRVVSDFHSIDMSVREMAEILRDPSVKTDIGSIMLKPGLRPMPRFKTMAESFMDPRRFLIAGTLESIN